MSPSRAFIPKESAPDLPDHVLSRFPEAIARQNRSSERKLKSPEVAKRNAAKLSTVETESRASFREIIRDQQEATKKHIARLDNLDKALDDLLKGISSKTTTSVVSSSRSNHAN